MQTVKAFYNGSSFVPLTPVNAKQNQQAIVTILEEETLKPSFFDCFGVLPKESAQDIMEALNDTEKVDINEW